jgi:hypothetical protein
MWGLLVTSDKILSEVTPPPPTWGLLYFVRQSSTSSANHCAASLTSAPPCRFAALNHAPGCHARCASTQALQHRQPPRCAAWLTQWWQWWQWMAKNFRIFAHIYTVFYTSLTTGDDGDDGDDVCPYSTPFAISVFISCFH